LSKRTENGWEPLHAFDDIPQRAIDYVVAHHYTSAHPRSPFTGRLIVMRLDHGVSRRLVGDELTGSTPTGALNAPRWRRST
jgi:N-hydroxyarylamine O-acetyltransferase